MPQQIRILVLGSSGLIGTSLTQMLKKSHIVFTTSHERKNDDSSINLDLLSDYSIEKAFELSRPEIVINLCAIYKNLDFCEDNKKLVMSINGTSLIPISKLSNKFRSFLINLSTDYVFDGKKGNYKESDLPSPINFYGVSKYEGEKNIQEIADRYCIVRTSMVYGRNSVKKTLPDWILDEIRSGNELRIINDQYMTPTYLENLCKMLMEIIRSQYGGIIHLAGPERMSRYVFALKLLRVFGLSDDKLIPVESKEFSFGSKMPKDSSLNTEKAHFLLKEKPESVLTSLENYKNKLDENA